MVPCGRLRGQRMNRQFKSDSMARRKLLAVVAAVLGTILAGQLDAQTVTVLHSFNGVDGASPAGSLLIDGNTLYGTTSAEGFSGGTLFTMGIDGTRFKLIFNFDTCDG